MVIQEVLGQQVLTGDSCFAPIDPSWDCFFSNSLTMPWNDGIFR